VNDEGVSVEAAGSDVVIRRVRDPFGCLGNMSPHPVSYHGDKLLGEGGSVPQG
jgi:hypothetical protein